MPSNNHWRTSPLPCPVVMLGAVVIPQETSSDFRIPHQPAPGANALVMICPKTVTALLPYLLSRLVRGLLKGALHYASLVHWSLDAVDRLLSSLLYYPCWLGVLCSHFFSWGFPLTPCCSDSEYRVDQEK